MKRSEYPRISNVGSDAVPIHVRPKEEIDAPKDHADLLACQIIEQLADGLRGGVVNIRNRSSIDDEPANGGRCVRHERAHFVSKEVLIRIKQIRVKTIDD